MNRRAIIAPLVLLVALNGVAMANALVSPPDVTKTRLCTIPSSMPTDKASRQIINCATEQVLAPIKQNIPPKDQLFVVTFNLERGARLDRQLDSLKAHFPSVDVFLLSEVDRGCRRSGFKNIAHEYAKAYNLHYAYGVEFYEAGPKCEHGNAILSKYPLENVQMVPFDRDGTHEVANENRLGKRMYLKANITVGNKTVTLYSTHLAARLVEEESDRKAQADQLARDAGAQKNPVIVGGDFNFFGFRALKSLYPPYKRFIDAGLSDTNAGMSTKVRRTHIDKTSIPIIGKVETNFVLDFIFTKNVSVVRSGVGDREAFFDNRASDHMPVWAVIKLN